MAIGWWTALKVIPWGQVIEHAPVVLKGARRLMERQLGEQSAPQPAQQPVPAAAAAVNGPVEVRIEQLEAGLAEARARLAASAELQRQGDEVLAALAEQNARLVEAVDVLRLRTRLLLGAAAVLAGATAALAWRVLGG